MTPLRIRVLGSGNAFNSDGRGSAAILVEPPASSPFLVDVGPTLPAALGRYAIDSSRIDRIFITHLHGDHIAGWPFLWLRWLFLQPRNGPVDVYGPMGTTERLNGLGELCYPELAGYQNFDVRFRELEVSLREGIDGGPGLRFGTRKLDHIESSIGYRFEVGGRSIAVTGDTRWCVELERLVEGADLACVECTSLEPGSAAHLSLREIRERRADLAAETVLLVHLTDGIAESLATDPIPGVLAAHDGMIVEL